MKLIKIITALLFAVFSGAAIAHGLDVDPGWGIGSALLASLVPMPQGVACVGIAKEIWIDQIKEGFYPDTSFLSESEDYSEFVEYNKIHLAEAGIEPEVLIDNNVFPVPIETRTDIPLEIPLKTFDTKNTVVRNIEEKESSYNKMESVVRQHRNALRKKTAVFATHAWAPSSNAALTPVLKSTGDVNKQGLKRACFEDFLELDTQFRTMDVDPDSLIAILNPTHLADLRSEDMKLYKEILKDRKLFNFKLYFSAHTPYYTVASGAKKAFGAAIDPAFDTQASIVYCKNEVMRADGDYEVFAKYKDPEQRGDVIGFQKRFIAMPIRGKYISAIFSDK